jgi:tetratricopeptide (TPR) repeat protein
MPNPAAEQAFAEAARLFRLGQHGDAMRLTARAVELDPAHAEAALEYARMLVAARRVDAAEQVLRRALAATPGHFALMSDLGVLLGQTSRSEGIAWLRRAAAAQPDNAVARYNLANALKTEGDIDAAIAEYEAALERDPRFAAARTNLGNALAIAGRVRDAAAAHEAATALRRSPQAAAADSDASFRRTSHGKLRHDIEQLEHLLARDVLRPEARPLLDDYRAALAALPLPPAGAHVVDLSPPHRARLAGTYNRLWHRPATPALPQGALNPDLDRAAIEADYARNHPGITHVDELLRPEALQSLRRFCLESTIWFQFAYANGYLGAFWEQGFWCPLIDQIQEELRLALPGIFRHHKLRKTWAFKYDSALSGIPMHADFAAVNVNFWITPDAANLDPDHGGLVVWDKEAPADWDFAAYNTDLAAMQRFLKDSDARAVTIPHRQNRAAIFNSDLFHATDRISFAPGYENRRINITLLYGTRGG